MPRPLHEPNIRNPTKIQNNFVTPVGADRCVGPPTGPCLPDVRNGQARSLQSRHTMSFSKHIWYRCMRAGHAPPLQGATGSPLPDHASEPRHPPWRGGLNCKVRRRRAIPRSGPGCRGTAPARSHKRAPTPSVEGRSFLQGQTPARTSARLCRAVRLRALPAPA